MMCYVLAYWRACEARGERPQPVWALVHEAGSVQPEGYTQGWSVSKRWAAKEADRVGGKVRLAKLQPV